MPYWQLYYHLVWATARREPLITPALEQPLHQYLRGKGLALGGTVYAVGGVEDHVHVVVAIPPRAAVSTYVGQLKGASSHWVNHVSGLAALFEWQDGYGVLSLSKRELPRVVEYVLNQHAHHHGGELYAVMERIEIEDVGP